MNKEQYEMDDNFEVGEARLLKLLNGEEYVVTHVGGGVESPIFSNRKSIVYKDPRQMVYHEQGIALVPVLNFFHEKYKGTHRVAENLVVSYMKVNSALEQDYRSSVSKIAQPTPDQVKAVGQSKILLE